MVAPGSTDRTRLGITVTKKVGQATVRNRIKRLTREYFRKNKSTFIKSWDMNLIAKKSISDLDSDQVFSALEDIFQRIRKSFEH